MSLFPFRRQRRNVKNLFKLLLESPSSFIWFLKCLNDWESRAPNEWKSRHANLNICWRDRYEGAGFAKGHYFLQDIWAAQKVNLLNPNPHVDIGSSIQGFVSHVACFTNIEYVDIRTLQCNIPRVSFKQGSILSLPYADNSIKSLSCLHVIEHIGLGRYGDPIDPDGWWMGISELQRVLAPGGQLLLSTPCGVQCVHFNAHRIFSPSHIIRALQQLKLIEFSLIKDDNSTEWIQDCPLDAADNLSYGCGLFVFKK